MKRQDSPNISGALEENGYLFLPNWNTNEQLLVMAESIGHIVDIRKVLPNSGIPTTQVLIPRRETDSPPNQYSTKFGLSPYPLHTDLANWTQPPRYIMFRCIRGTANVATNLLKFEQILNIIGTRLYERALFRPRHAIRKQSIYLLPMYIKRGQIRGIRWDSLFIKPMNREANKISKIMEEHHYMNTLTNNIHFKEYGDTLIIDNWRCLHSRSNVPESSMNRCIERVYIKDIFV